MISNLREKLKAMSTNCPSVHNKSNASDQDIPRGNLDGQIQISSLGEYVMRRSSIDMKNACYGIIQLKHIHKLKQVDFEQWFSIKEAHPALEDYIFLDTETTGLSGGMGTIAFLIGLGYFEHSHLIVEQYIMRDYDEEAAVLDAVMGLLKRKKVLVTFNGKAFDWPLLETRMVYNRIRSVGWEGRHIDLLYSSRRIWKNKLDSCSLVSLEENILGEIRQEDIPGSMIPQVYFQYLQDRNPELMNKVVHHNLSDIVAMAALLIHMAHLLGDINGASMDVYELLSFGKLYESIDEEQAVFYYSECIKRNEKNEITREARRRLAFLYKRQKKFSEAMNQWQSLSNRSGNMNISPLIEMAKYYEHKTKQYEQAISCVDKVLDILLKHQQSQIINLKLSEVQHRRRRLQKKIERRDSACQL